LLGADSLNGHFKKELPDVTMASKRQRGVL
jgi:hypothetical protein